MRLSLVTTIVVLTLAATGLQRSGMRLLAADSSPSDARVHDALFAGQHIRESAISIHQQARRLPPRQRYVFLADWVLPGTDHDAFRLQAGFTTTHPAPGEDRPLPPGTMVETGGEIVAPALDLIDAAVECGELSTLQQQVTAIDPNSPRQQFEQKTLLALIAINEQDEETAAPLLEEVFAHYFAESGPTLAREDALLLCVHRAPRAPQIARLLLEPTYQTVYRYQMEAYHRVPWQRQFSAAWGRLQQSVVDTDSQVPPTNVSAMRQWFPVSRKLAAQRGTGSPPAVWTFRPGEVKNLSSHDEDYLYFRSPLTGNYAVEGDVTGFEWRDSQLIVAGKWVGPVYDHESYDVGNLRALEERRRFSPPLTRTKDYIRYRTVLDGAHARTWFNGRHIHDEPLPEVHDPWLAIRSSPRHEGGVRNLRVTGEAVIPDRISLSQPPDLAGWVPYFDERMGLDWRGIDGEIQGRHQQEYPAGCFKESLLAYQRPMLEDGHIDYEFWYEPGRCTAHAALDRLCLVLHDDGVRVHWLTDGRFEQSPLPPDNLTSAPQHQRGGDTLPLRENDWNQVRLSVAGDQLALQLNGQPVFERPLESTNQRTFGLFYFADQTSLRVRNVVWTGSWPRELPGLEAQELFIDETGFLDAGRDDWTAIYHHDFRQDGLPLTQFAIVRGTYPDHLSAQPDGLHAGRSAETGYRNATIAPSLTVQGDFDVLATYDGLVTECYGSGSSRIMLIALAGNETGDEATLIRQRTRARGGDRQLVQCLRVFDENGQQRRRYFDHLPVEATSGTLRLSRRGDQIYYLFAENDSPHFRLFGQADYTTSDLAETGVRLLTQIHGDQGQIQVVWKELTIRAEGLAGGALGAADPQLVALNTQRDQLAAQDVRDFGQQPAEEPLFHRWTSRLPWSAEEGGVVMVAPGTDDWTSAGMALRRQAEGDFDVSCTLGDLELALPAEGKDSNIYLQVELRDQARTQVSCVLKKQPGGDIEIVAQLRVPLENGEYDYRRIGQLSAETLDGLRVARRGQQVFYLASSPQFGGERIIATTSVAEAPVPSTGVRLILHTGGAGRESRVVWKSLSVRAERLSPSPEPEATPTVPSFFERLFNGPAR